MLISNSIISEQIDYLKTIKEEIIGININHDNKKMSVIGWYNPPYNVKTNKNPLNIEILNLINTKASNYIIVGDLNCRDTSFSLH
jgi:hypothetical protein